MSNQEAPVYGVRIVVPLREPREPEAEQSYRVEAANLCIALAVDNDLDTLGEVELAETRYGRYVETYPPGDSSRYVQIGMPDGTEEPMQVLVPSAEPLVMFLDCREEVATHMVVLAQVPVATRATR